MDDVALARLEHLFPRLEVLAPPVRLQVSELLARPCSPPAVLEQEIADLPLPSSTSDSLRRALRSVIEKGLGQEALAALHPLRLSEVVPSIQTCDGGPVTIGCPVRLRDLLQRQAATTWAELGPRALSEMATWPSMGPSTLAGLVGAAVEAVLATASAPAPAADDPDPLAEPEPEPESAALALALLLHHERASGAHRLRRAIEAHTKGGGPAEVRAAASRLLAAADRAGDPRLAALDRVWEAVGDHRDRGILVHQVLRLDRRTSTRELTRALGLSESRLRKIRADAEQRTDSAVPDAVKELAAGLRDRLGTVCRVAAVDDALAALDLPPTADPRSALLVWLAGPYVPVNGQAGWVATEPATVLADTRRLLHEDGGVRQLDHVAADLGAAGIAAHDVDDWLRGHSAATLDGLVVALSGSAADVAERLLSATGRAMTAAELASVGANPEAAASLDSRLRADKRFLNVDRDHFELAEWGGEPFTEPPLSPPAELFGGAGRGTVPTGRSTLRIDVDTAVLRGASDRVPQVVIDALGVPCGGRRTFTTRFGPVALIHTAAQASRGSVRPVALAAGARDGDSLVLEFDAGSGDASVELVLASSSAAS